MKANEAPKKIFLEWYRIGDKKYRDWCITPKTNNETVEYTRTDAFIEKACEYFRSGLEDVRVIDDYRDIAVRGIQASYTSVEEFIENFKNYMKGE